MTQLDKWPPALETLVKRMHDEDRVTPQVLHHIAVMTINQKVAWMMLTMTFQTLQAEKKLYRDFDSTFEVIICHARSLLRPINILLNSDVKRTSPFFHDSPMPLFNFAPGIIHPLFFTAMKCRNTAICQEAIQLLYNPPWREGAWDSAAMAQIAKRALIQRPFERFPDAG